MHTNYAGMTDDQKRDQQAVDRLCREAADASSGMAAAFRQSISLLESWLAYRDGACGSVLAGAFSFAGIAAMVCLYGETKRDIVIAALLRIRSNVLRYM
jgi:hypothetical protein